MAGIGLSGAGAYASNEILTSVMAYAENSTLGSSKDILIKANSKSDIDALVMGVSVAVGAGGKGGVGVPIGASIAHNYIGYTENGSRQSAEVQALLKEDCVVNASGSLTLTAISEQTINAKVGAGSVALAAGGMGGIGLGGSGVSANNKIAIDITASIGNDSKITASSITLTAEDKSTIYAHAGAASLAASLAGAGAGSLSCLLYTSPSPRDRTRSRMPSSA